MDFVGKVEETLFDSFENVRIIDKTGQDITAIVIICGSRVFVCADEKDGIMSYALWSPDSLLHLNYSSRVEWEFLEDLVDGVEAVW